MKHLPCPVCPSHDAYTVYADGSGHCFSCGYHLFISPYVKMKRALRSTATPEAKDVLLPKDTCLLKAKNQDAWAWLKRYELTDAEIDENNMCWSENEQLLIFPVHGKNLRDLLMWQGRYFGWKKNHPKYITRGLRNDVLHIVGKQHGGDTLVLTEDLVSAIKCSRVAPAMPLWGSHIDALMATRLAPLYGHFKLWLDYDKSQASVNFAIKLGSMMKIKPVITVLDPKEYSYEQMKEILK